MAKVKIKNMAKGPRGLFSADGYVQLEPGEEMEVDLSDADRKGLASYFDEVKDAAPKKAKTE